MDRTSITPHLPGRPATRGRLPSMRLSSALGRHPVSDCIEIFKKTPFVAGLHPVSRDAVKDPIDIASIPLLTTILLDHDGPAGEVIACSGRGIAKNEFAIAGAMSLPGGDLENHYYADR